LERAAGGSETIRNHAAFIWSVADLLRRDYEQSECGKAILPLTSPLTFTTLLDDPDAIADSLRLYIGGFLGPALNVRGSYTGPRGEGETRLPTEAIAAGGRGVIAFENWTGASLKYSGEAINRCRR
jgi:hypothetical protein